MGKKRQLSHADKLAKIRPFVDMEKFRGNLKSKGASKLRAKISRYYKLIWGGENTPRMFSFDKRVYRARNKQNLKIMKRYGMMPEGYPDIKVAFIQETGDGSRIRINKRNKTVTVINKGIASKTEFFDTKEIKKAVRKAIRFKNARGINVEEPGDEKDIDDIVFAELVRQFELSTVGDPAGTYYQIYCGDHILGSASNNIGAVFLRDAALDMLKFLLAKYDNAHQWMNGVKIYTFPGQEYDNDKFLEYLNQMENKKLAKRMEARDVKRTPSGKKIRRADNGSRKKVSKKVSKKRGKNTDKKRKR